MFVTVLIHNEAGSWWAETPDVSGYSAAADTREELENLVVEGLRTFLGEIPNLMIAFQMADQAVGAATMGVTSTGIVTSTVGGLAGNEFGVSNSGQGAASLAQPAVLNVKAKATTPELAATG